MHLINPCLTKLSLFLVIICRLKGASLHHEFRTSKLTTSVIVKMTLRQLEKMNKHIATDAKTLRLAARIHCRLRGR